MKTATTLRRALPALRAAGIAAALACTATLSWASGASISIAWFGVSAEQYSGNYVTASNPYQSFIMAASNGGGSVTTDNYAAFDWAQGFDRLAQTSNAMATGNTVTFTDPSTQLATSGFNLTTAAQPVGDVANTASAAAAQSGVFRLIDGNGDAVAGSITFDIYYDLTVSPPVSGSPATYAQTALSLLLSSSNGSNQSFSDGLASGSIAGGTGMTSGHFTWTLNLAAGEYVYYALNSSATAAAVAAVPEPDSYILLGAGLGVIGFIARRRRSSVQS